MFTVTPGSIVKVTPLATPTGPVSVYGLLAFVHVVYDVIMPITSSEACTAMKCTLFAKTKPTTNMANRNAPIEVFNCQVPSIPSYFSEIYGLFCFFFICQIATQPVPTTVTMMPTAITVTIHPQFGVSDEILLFTLTIGSTTGDGVSVELLIWTGVAFAFGVGEVVGVYEVEVVG